MANTVMQRIFDVMSDSVNADGICSEENQLLERLGQLNPEDDHTVRRNVGSYLPNDTA